jgi:hypothetical protein
VRNRIRMIVSATLLVAVFSMTIASAAPRTGGSGVDAAQGTQPAITPIQQLSLSLGKEQVSQGNQEGSTETVARVGDKVGQVPGFCRLHS